MEIERAIELMKNEKACVLRQDSPECNRDSCGCQCCDLVVETDEILEAYDLIIELASLGAAFIDTMVEFLVNHGFESVEEFQEFLEKMKNETQ